MNDIESNIFSEAKQRITSGDVIILPTETVYGIAVDATNNSAIEKIYLAKGRNREVPLQLMCASFKQAETYGIFNASALKLAGKFFPGAITLVVEKNPAANIASNINIKNSTIGIRVPDHKLLLDFLTYLNMPIAISSANISGEPAPITYDDAIKKLAPSGVNFGIDGGQSQLKTGSTVIDVTDESNIKILRVGTITEAEIFAALK